MPNGVPVTNVTQEHLGVWIAGSSVNNPFEFSVAIVELARANGFDMEHAAWEEDVPKFLSGDADLEMVEDLAFLTDASLDFLQEELPEGFYFDFDDGLVLFFEDDFEN